MTKKTTDLLEKFKFQGRFDHIAELIEKANNAAEESDHDEFRVGAAMHSVIGDHHLSWNDRTNKIPAKLRQLGLTTIKTNGTNPTSHGELLLLKDTSPAAKNYLGCNYPNCPNCTKKAIIHGVYAVVIDSVITRGQIMPRKFLEPTKEKRLADGWYGISLPMLKAAGIHVLGYDPDRKVIKIISHGLPRDQRPKLTSLPLYIEPYVMKEREPPKRRHNRDSVRLTSVFSSEKENKITGTDLVAKCNELHSQGHQTAVARVRDRQGRYFILGARDTRPPGMTTEMFDKINADFAGTRYSVSICPLTRLMIEAPKRGFTLDDGLVACNYMPQVGRHIDLVSCGVRKLELPAELFRAARRDPDFKLIDVIEKRKKKQKTKSGVMAYELSDDFISIDFEPGADEYLVHSPS